jgi:kynurenine 3-monooxygenase
MDAHLKAVYPDFYEVAGKEAVAQHQRRPVGYMVMVETAPWHWDDKVILLGDAAHGVFPFFGQGANAGFEDVVALMNSLRGGASSWGDVFRAVQEARKGDVDSLRELSAEHGDVLARGLGESDGRRRAELEHALHELDPARFASLYQWVAFSELGYYDAMVNGRKQELLIDRLLKEGDAVARVRARDSEFIELVDAVGRELGII